MTTLTKPATGTGARVRFGDLIAAEWIKLWSLRSTCWGLAVTALIVVGMNANSAISDMNNWERYSQGIRDNFVPTWSIRDAFTDPAALVLVLATASIGAIMIVGEYSSGLIRTTFAAVPARRAVLAAKFLVVTPVMLAYGAVVSATSFGVTQAILSSRDVGLSISYPGALQAVTASALLPAVCALVGMGLGALIRHTATTIVTATLLLLLLPTMIEPNQPWKAALHHALPLNAWQRLTDISPVNLGPPILYPATITESWLVYAAWPLVAVVLTLIVIPRRDV
ncbi:ABC transporter permease [Micromonospora sp. NPDC003197]